MTGTEIRRSPADDMYARDRACQALGIQLVDVTPGRARLRMRVTDRMVNGHGVAHGGYVFLLADAAFAYASNAYGPVTLAQSAQIEFLRPATVDDRLEAEAVERTRRGLTGIYDVTIRRIAMAESASSGAARNSLGHGAASEVVAEFRGHGVVLPRARAGGDLMEA